MPAPAKILLVDNQSTFSDELCRRLAKHNHVVSLVRNPQNALVQLNEVKNLAVVILNVTTHEWNGIETLQQIKAQWPLVEVIILAEYADVETAVQAIKSGAYDYLQKPVEMEKLVTKIEAASEKKQLRDRQILELYMKPYITQRARKEQLAAIMAGKAGSENL